MKSSQAVRPGRVLGLRVAALVAASLWALFALLYLGVEDGSSGLSLLGNLTLAFFMPGLLLMQALEGAHSNADMPFMAFMSWLVYAIAGQVIVTLVLWLRNRLGFRSNAQKSRA
ncbi:MAG: hypothetical protein ACYS26_01200 [Planctomycetota bacterium]